MTALTSASRNSIRTGGGRIWSTGPRRSGSTDTGLGGVATAAQKAAKPPSTISSLTAGIFAGRGSEHDLAAGDVEGHAGDPGGAVGGQEQHGAGHVLRAPSRPIRDIAGSCARRAPGSDAFRP